MNKKRIVITGIGAVTPIGIGKDAYWKGLQEGKTGVKPITLFDTKDFNVKAGGEITDFNAKEILGRKGLVDLDRSTTLLLAASQFALADGKLEMSEENTYKTGISVGTTFGSLNSILEFDRESIVEGPNFVNASRFPNTVINSPASRVAIRHGIKGLNSTISTGICSGLDALDYAVHQINFNRADRILVGSVEEMCLQTFLGFYKLDYLSGIKNGQAPISRPFDKKRDGIVFGEGASIVILEELSAAKQRKAKIYGEILSISSNFDPYKLHDVDWKDAQVIYKEFFASVSQEDLMRQGLQKGHIKMNNEITNFKTIDRPQKLNGNGFAPKIKDWSIKNYYAVNEIQISHKKQPVEKKYKGKKNEILYDEI